MKYEKLITNSSEIEEKDYDVLYFNETDNKIGNYIELDPQY